MRRAEMVRSSGFRIAVLFLSLFLVAAALAGSAAFLIIRDELVARHQRAIDEEYDFFAGLYTIDGQKDLVELLDAHAAAARGNDSVYLLRGPSGDRIAGNLPALPPPAPGRISARALGLSGDFDYFVRSGRIGDMNLLVGASGEDLSEVEEVFIEGASWAALLLIAISLAGGAALSMKMNRRIGAIDAALERVAAGDFAARIPQSGRDDDIDRLGRLIDSAVERLGELVETNRQISADIAHDLKTPMNRLRISVEQARERAANGEDTTVELDEIDRESVAILSTFDALLRIAQIESGARRARFSSVDLAALASDIAGLYRPVAEDGGGSLVLSLPATAPTIEGDRELLGQMLANLIENALKHAGGRANIRLSLLASHEGANLTVADDGPGIPDGEREHVLRRLYRLEKSRSTPGSGLGLSTVKAIADLHGATIRLGDNRPGLVVDIAFPKP